MDNTTHEREIESDRQIEIHAEGGREKERERGIERGKERDIYLHSSICTDRERKK